MTPFELNGKRYNIHLTYKRALLELPKKFNIKITKLFLGGDESTETLERIVMDDELAVDLLWYFIEDEAVFSKEELLDNLTGSDLDRFREAFWEEVASFFGPLRQNLVRQVWKAFKKELKKADLEKMQSTKSSTEQSQEESE